MLMARILLIPPDKKMCILFVNNICIYIYIYIYIHIENIKNLWHMKTWYWLKFKKFKCFNTLNLKILHLGKIFQYSQVLYYKGNFFIKMLCILPARYFQNTRNDVLSLDSSEAKLLHIFVIYDNSELL